MKFAPIGVGAALAVTVGVGGLPVLVKLGKAALTLYGALVAFILLGFIPVALIARVPLKRFWAAIKEPALIAFSTTSSEAAMPSAFQHMEELGVPRRIVGFVIPTGYSFNLDGTTLYLSMASVFCAQAAGIHMTLGQQLFMMLTIMLTSKGVAGVPRAALVVLSGTVATFGLPLEAVAVLLGIDVIMDMGRTTINLVGNCLASVVMARWEGEFAEPAMRAATSNAA
jgi:proton glutamate symport protein